MPLVFYTSDIGGTDWYGSVYIGRLLLTEYFDVSDTISAGGSSGNGDPGLPRTLTVTGQESWPPLATVEEVRYRGEQLMAMNYQIVPVVFASKVDRNGYYVVTSPEVDWHHYGGVMSGFEWTVVLERYGTEAEVMIESRLIGGTRTSYYTGNVAERWHSPGSGSVGYYAGSDVPSSIARSGSEGAVTVYRDLAPGASARWGASPYDYLDGSSRITVAGDVMCGLTLQNQPSNWTLENTLIQIAPSSTATFTLNWWDGTEYKKSVDWSLFIGPGTTLLTDPSYISILRNDPEECILRITYLTDAGYSTVDFSLRRGARFVGIVVQNQASNVFEAWPSAYIPVHDSGNGYCYQVTNDSDGNRFTMGSATQVVIAPSAGVMVSSVPETFFSCYVGIEVGGSSANDGDTAADLAAQFLGLCAEDTRVISR